MYRTYFLVLYWKWRLHIKPHPHEWLWLCFRKLVSKTALKCKKKNNIWYLFWKKLHCINWMTIMIFVILTLIHAWLQYFRKKIRINWLLMIQTGQLSNPLWNIFDWDKNKDRDKGQMNISIVRIRLNRFIYIYILCINKVLFSLVFLYKWQ